jgi:hypothetical protein
MKTSELTGAALDWAVAQIEWVAHDSETNALMVTVGDDNGWKFKPSTDWSQGGPIIEREGISVEYNRAEFTWLWTAYKLGDPHEDNPEGGPTPLIAAMRCYVASKLGDDVEIPDELKE